MRRIGLLTSGGDAPGMNAAVRAVVHGGVVLVPATARQVSGEGNQAKTVHEIMVAQASMNAGSLERRNSMKKSRSSPISRTQSTSSGKRSI